MISTTAMFT